MRGRRVVGSSTGEGSGGIFFQSARDQPHPERTRAILARHPAVRALMGRNPWTALVMAGVVSLQIAIAWQLGRLGLSHWWLSLLLAYLVGAFASHCLYVIIHEATHNLVFRGGALNSIVALLADLPNVAPAAIGFRACHLSHHAHQGDYRLDVDLPSRWEARLAGNRWYGKAAWLLLFPVVEAFRPMHCPGVRFRGPWFLLNCTLTLLFDATIAFVCGANALVYLAGSLFFAVGLHPLGGRWIQEHFTIDPSQETASYYGVLNLLALNVGYHNEHHDFPSVPWSRLPRLRAMAPEFYSGLNAHRSWTRAVLRFIFDPRFSVASRVERARPAAP